MADPHDQPRQTDATDPHDRTDSTDEPDRPDVPRTRFLPMTTSAAVDLAAGGLDEDAAHGMRRAAHSLGAVLHARYRERWVSARAAAEAGGDELLDELGSLLDRANYDEVPREVLEQALGESAVFSVQVEADLDDFAELRFWRRGVTRQRQEVSRWRGLRQRTVEFLEYDRVAMYARYHDEDRFRRAGRKVADLGFTPGTEHVKLFQDVPEPDLEMLLPGTRVSMRTVDKVVIGVPAVVGGVVVAATKLASAVGFLVVLVGAYLGLRRDTPDISTGVLVTLFGAVVALASYLWRQWTKYKNRKTEYLKTLSESLYARTLADGPGVLYTVLDGGEAEDVKEAVLAYRGLLDGDTTSEALDDRVESWLHDACGDGVDFEVPDALGRLEALGLAQRSGDRWSATPLDAATDVLRERWRELGDALAGEPEPSRSSR